MIVMGFDDWNRKDGGKLAETTTTSTHVTIVIAFKEWKANRSLQGATKLRWSHVSPENWFGDSVILHSCAVWATSSWWTVWNWTKKSKEDRYCRNWISLIERGHANALLTQHSKVEVQRCEVGSLSITENFHESWCYEFMSFIMQTYMKHTYLSVYQNVNKRRYVVWLALRVDLRIAYATAVSAYAGHMLRVEVLTRSLRETAFAQNEHQTTAPAYKRRFSARNWIIPSAYASAYALALLQFTYASLRNSGFGLREASYDTTLSTHVKGGLGGCSILKHNECIETYWNVLKNILKHDTLRLFDVSKWRYEKFWLKIWLGTGTSEANTERCACSVVWTRRGSAENNEHAKSRKNQTMKTRNSLSDSDSALNN